MAESIKQMSNANGWLIVAGSLALLFGLAYLKGRVK